MKKMTSVPRALAAPVLLLALGLLACSDDDSPTDERSIFLFVARPVEAFEGSGVDCAEFPVEFRDPGGEGGTLEAIEVSAIRTNGSVVLATNRRPNQDFTFPDTEIPPGGELEVEGAVCWPPEPMGTGLAIRVRAELEPRDQRPIVQVPMIGPRDEVDDEEEEEEEGEG